MSALRFLVKKEFIQFRRNKFVSRLVFAFPVVVMLIVPLVTNMEVRGVRVAVIDADGSQLSRRMLSHVEASKSLQLVLVGSDYNLAYRQLEDNRLDVIVSIPKRCEQTLLQGQLPRIRVDANAVNATKSGLGSQYVVAALGKAIAEMGAERGMTVAAKDISVRYFYNETLDYRFYMIPAFIIILVLLICCFIPALNLVIEKEKGTIEQINVTPVGRLEFTLSKLIPYWLVGIVVLTEAILTAGLVYGLWPAGNVGTIYLAALLFVLTMSGFAIAVANVSDTMQQCIFVLFFFVMIFMLMSGMLTPLESMPQWAQWITVVFPPRWFVGIMRAVYLKGTTLAELAPDFLALVALAVAFCSIAMLTYRKQK
ncbi:MAG: ABC transporter permease [Bacteroidales bacterium]|nr:ABC transporter permease [Bacteroidales bacterium]